MSCLFDSLSSELPGTSKSIRNKICDYLKQDNKIIDGLKTSDVLNLETSSYITNMRKTSTWGGAIEIQCACNIWKIRILVEDSRHKKKHNIIEFIPVNNTYNKTINLKWSGGHYKRK